ncbi:hypothetical protein KIN20_007398 [Parelaphostrongylus tenuis]|uniref:Uncharacterized protein n=1 Tax=Parelaphostrongylus tenuis TaxID=148309 RepID=A0AAD5QHV2_PARTN|nr:hypothetical protein KIN20_007398 [Parelaphostrongylus tenuis]
MISLLAMILTVFGCGVISSGQASTRTFNVSGFTLPVAMVYSAAPEVRARVPDIAADMDQKHHHGELVENDVAKCIEQSGSNVSIRPVRISFLLGICHCRWKLKSNCASTRTFNVSGFSLPVAMAYTEMLMISAQVSGITASKGAARAFVQRLMMQTVFDVLESQARSALLPDAVISGILSQLTVNITYEPLLCQQFVRSLMETVEAMRDYCIIVSNTVTGICRHEMKKMCTDKDAKLMPVPATAMSISGTISTTNIIMANWSTMMWENVVNRAIRMLAVGPFRSHFISGSATVGGN